jgi:hypothetical protein
MSTSDGERTWTNISERVKSTVHSDVVQDINWRTPSQILFLTVSGNIISSSDRGETWTQVVQFKDERPNGSVSSTGYYRLAFDTRGRVRVIAGAKGDEGYWGDLITTHESGTWDSHELIRTPMRDAVFVSDTEVVACGRQLYPYDENTGTIQPSVGIILHSTDSGKSWSAIYRSKSDETFISLTKIDDKQFYAVSDAGTFVRFTLRRG